MCVPVEHCGDRVPHQRFFETAATEKRKDLWRFSFHGLLDWRVVQDCNQVIVTQSRQRRFELQRLGDRFVNELLDDVFAPWAKRAAAETAGEAFDARES